MTDKHQFFSSLDLKREGLEIVQEHFINNNYDGTAQALLDYFRSRTGIQYYDGWDQRPLGQSYDLTKADEVCNNRLVHQDLPEDIDWKADPHGDPEWTYCLNRHEYLTELGRAYWYTGNEKYTHAFIRILSHWINNNPMPDLEWMLNVDSETSRMHFMKQGTWRPLTLGIRMYTSFVPNFFHFLHSPFFTPDFLVTMLNSMVEHARHTRLYYTRHKSYFNVSPNWGLMESNGLAHMGILFPEFKESNDWRVEAMSRFEEQIRMQVLPDGMQVERASGYHLVCTFCFLQILDLAQRNHVRVSDTYMRMAEKMVEFIATLMKPHGYYPMLKDADESDVFGERASYGLWEDINNLNMLEDANDLRWVFKAGARLFKRPDFLYIATHGQKGVKPEFLSVANPHAGFYVMRSGWEHDDLYMVYTCGELGVADQNCVHGNADALNIDVSAHGETLLIDPGRYIYEGPWRIWFKSTQAHNTVVVDGKDSSELADEWMFKTWANSKLHCWSNGEKLDYVDGSHDGYQRLQDPVTHRRKVAFVKPHFWLIVDELSANEEHEYDQYFHFSPEARLDIAKDLSVTAKYKNGAGLIIKQLAGESLHIDHFRGSTDPIQGWVSFDYAVKVPADAIRFRKKAKTTRYITLLLPFKDHAADCHATILDEKAVEIRFEGKTFLLIFSDGSEMSHGDFVFDGDLLCAEYDHGGRLTACFGAKTSKIIHKGEVILDQVVRDKQDRTITL